MNLMGKLRDGELGSFAKNQERTITSGTYKHAKCRSLGPAVIELTDQPGLRRLVAEGPETCHEGAQPEEVVGIAASSRADMVLGSASY